MPARGRLNLSLSVLARMGWFRCPIVLKGINLREVADRHPGVRRERGARKRGPRHRFWPPAGAAAAAGAAAPAGAVADCDSAWEGSQKLKIGALKRLVRVGGAPKVGDPTPRNGHSA